MKIKTILLKRVICFLLTLMVFVSFPNVHATAKSSVYTIDDLEQIIDGTLAYKQNQATVSTVQELINTKLADSAGVNSADWLIIALYRYKKEYDYSNYLTSLDTYTGNVKNAQATDLQRMALDYSAVGENEKFIKDTINNSTGKLGVMSYIYGLILLDSRDYTNKDLSREDIIDKILDLRLSDGGWALSGTVSDIDVTAMALQALSPYTKDSDVSATVDKAVTLLSKRQQDTGDYKSWGTRCCESTAQVITALTALNIDFQTDKRFIKNNKSLLDGLFLYKQSDGSFSHIINGKSDNTASVQAMYSLIAAWRQMNGLSSFYNFSNTNKTKFLSDQENADTENTDKSGTITSDTSGSTATNQSGQTKDNQSIDTAKQTDTTSANNETTSSDQISAKDSQSGKTDQAESENDGQNTSGTSEQTTVATDGSSNLIITQAPSSNYNTDAAVVTPRVTPAATEFKADHNFHLDYKVILTILILAIALLILGMLYAMNRRSRKNYITVLAVAVVMVVAVWGIKLQSVDDYYHENAGTVQSDNGTVRLSIYCNTVAGKESNLPEDGIILDKTEFPIKDGDSVLDILILAAKQNKIPLDYDGGEDNSLSTAYVKGINDLYEDDFGEQSGWLYSVNGGFPGRACGDYKVKDQDEIVWVYTCDLGKDVGRE